MYNTLLRLYKAGTITEANLTKAVTLTWINEVQKAEIIASVTTK